MARHVGQDEKKALRACCKLLRRLVDATVLGASHLQIATLEPAGDLVRAAWPLRTLRLSCRGSPEEEGRMRQCERPNRDLGALLRTLRDSSWPALTSLRIDRALCTTRMARLLASCALPALEELELDGDHLSG